MAIHIITGTAPPADPPTELGQHYVDTSSDVHYLSVGTSTTADWVQVQNVGALGTIATQDADAVNIDGGSITGLSELRLPVSATPTVSTNGDIAGDTTVTDFSTGVVKFYLNEEQGIVALPIAAFTSPTDGHVVRYNGTNDEFELSAGGSGSSFGTIQVSGQSDVVADTSSDTLTLVAGSNITITTNAGTDTVTIAATGGSGTVTNTGGNLTSNAVVLGAGSNDSKVVAGITTDGVSALNLGVAGASVGKVVLANATSGSITMQAPTGALGTVTVTVPAATDTLVGKATTDTLTNKTLTSPTLTTPSLGVATATSINKVALTAPATGSTLTISDGKTLTASNSITLAGTDSTTMTFPATSTTVAGLSIANVFTKGQTVTPVRNTSASGSVTPDFSASNVFHYTLTGNLTIANGSSPTDGQVITFKLKQDGTGSRTLTLGSKYKTVGGAPTLSTAAGSLDILSYVYDAADDVYVGSFGKGAS